MKLRPATARELYRNLRNKEGYQGLYFSFSDPAGNRRAEKNLNEFTMAVLLAGCTYTQDKDSENKMVIFFVGGLVEQLKEFIRIVSPPAKATTTSDNDSESEFQEPTS